MKDHTRAIIPEALTSSRCDVKYSKRTFQQRQRHDVDQYLHGTTLGNLTNSGSWVERYQVFGTGKERWIGCLEYLELCNATLILKYLVH